jgi:excisionase family DNA binding protein
MDQSLLKQDRLLTFEEVRSFLNVSESTLRRWISAGKLKSYQPGRQLRFHPSMVASFLAERES